MLLTVLSRCLPLAGLLWCSPLLAADSGLPSLPPGNPPRPPALASLMRSSYGQLPVRFEPNVGQFDPKVRYAARGGNYTLLLTDSEMVIVLSRKDAAEQAAVRMKLLGARHQTQWEPLDRQPGISNYFLGNDPAKWRTDIPNFGRVAARGIYQGVDLLCYGNQRQLEYDLELAPGADPAHVQLAWDGADSLRLNEDGDLVLATPLGEVVQKRPRVYQQLGGRRVEIESRYSIARPNRVRFELARYDHSRPLRIDPLVLVYSTYLGGSGDDSATQIAVDSAGSAYVAGFTVSANLPVVSDYESTYQGGAFDAFVAKFSPAGDSLVYLTYLGGSDSDKANGIAVDSAGSAYVTGVTASLNFPNKSAWQSSYQGGACDTFVAKLAPAGNALVYSTFLGGIDADEGEAIAVDSAGSAYVTGSTSSYNFPTLSAFQGTYTAGPSASQAFVTKLAPAGNALAYSTFLGGHTLEMGHGIAVDAAGSAYVAGETASLDFPTKSSFQGTYQGGDRDGFLSKLAPSGNALVYSTYLGGFGSDSCQAVAVDQAGSAYVTGVTSSGNFPIQSAYQGEYQGGTDAFVMKLAPAGNALVYSTYLGGGGDDAGAAIGVDSSGAAYLTGHTTSLNFPMQLPYQSNSGGGSDAFVTKLTAAGNALWYSTYLGSTGAEYGRGIAVNAGGSAYVTGNTTSAHFPMQSAFQPTYQGGQLDGDAFVTKLQGNPGAVTLLAPANAAGSVALSPTLIWQPSTGAASYDVYFGLSSPPPFVANTANSSYVPGVLAAGTVYYWKVVAKSEIGTTTSDLWSFVTLVSPPAAPTLVSPANGATAVSTAPTLNWSASTGAASYDVYFGISSPPPVVTNTTGTSYSPDALAEGTTYYWMVAAKNPGGTAASTVWSFTTLSTPPPGLRFVPITPCRVADTRDANGSFGGPSIAGGTARVFLVLFGSCNIPTSAQAYSLNVTAVPQDRLDYLTLWPTGQTQPLVSTLNSWSGDVVANAAIVPAGIDGGVSVFVSNTTDVILDINGYFDNSTGASSYAFYPAAPCRVADTRDPDGQFGGPSIPGGHSRDFAIPSSTCTIPPTARAYSLNFTVVPPGYLGYLTTWPTGQPQPLVSTLNSWKGKIVANAAIVPAGTDQSISVFASETTDLVVDINGHFALPGSAGALSFYPVTPCRIADTREADGPFGGPIAQGGTVRSFTVPDSTCAIPSAAKAYSLNVTVVPSGALSYLTIWPAGAPQPLVSTLNSLDGRVLANAAIVPAGTGGAISVFVTGDTHVILDINGYFAP